MMRVVVAGGKLQGIEAAYLAHQAGWSVLLIDREASPPARGLCDQFCPGECHC
jgi:pyrrolysine biosynthesis protein PylC